MPVWAIIGIAVAAALIAWVLASVYTRRKDIKKVAYMMEPHPDHLREAAAGPRAGFLDQTHPGADA